MKSIINRLRVYVSQILILNQLRFLILWDYGIDMLLNEGEGRVKELLLVMT